MLWTGAAVGDAALPWLFLLGALLGAAFVVFDYGFTGGIARYAAAGDGRDLGASFVVPAVAALVVVPVGMLADGYQRLVAPIGVPSIGGAFVFGVGMQMAGACGSGCLVAAGQGSRRIWIALPMFCLGGVVGTALVPAAGRLPALGTIHLPALLGPWPGLAAIEALLLALALAVLRGAQPERRRLLAGAAIGLCWPPVCSWPRARHGASRSASPSGVRRPWRPQASISRGLSSGPNPVRDACWKGRSLPWMVR